MRGLWTTIVISSLVVTGVRGADAQQPSDGPYRAAYDRWRSAIEASPTTGAAGWFRTDVGSPAVRSAVLELLALGPNLVPLIIEELRQETNQLRVYRLVMLLPHVSGINVFYNSGEENFYEAAPEFKRRILAAWDSGEYTKATERLRAAWGNRRDEATPAKIDPKSLTDIQRYGVYAVPFIAETLRKQNSAPLFAAFLLVTGQRDAYTAYIDDPARLSATREEKLTAVRNWAARNERKLDRLSDLHPKIKALAVG